MAPDSSERAEVELAPSLLGPAEKLRAGETMLEGERLYEGRSGKMRGLRVPGWKRLLVDFRHVVSRRETGVCGSQDEKMPSVPRHQEMAAAQVIPFHDETIRQSRPIHKNRSIPVMLVLRPEPAR
jgi:hypothetical protein